MRREGTKPHRYVPYPFSHPILALLTLTPHYLTQALTQTLPLTHILLNLAGVPLANFLVSLRSWLEKEMEVAGDDLRILCVLLNKNFNFCFEFVFKFFKNCLPHGIMANPPMIDRFQQT